MAPTWKGKSSLLNIWGPVMETNENADSNGAGTSNNFHNGRGCRATAYLAYLTEKMRGDRKGKKGRQGSRKRNGKDALRHTPFECMQNSGTVKDTRMGTSDDSSNTTNDDRPVENDLVKLGVCRSFLSRRRDRKRSRIDDYRRERRKTLDDVLLRARPDVIMAEAPTHSVPAAIHRKRRRSVFECVPCHVGFRDRKSFLRHNRRKHHRNITCSRFFEDLK